LSTGQSLTIFNLKREDGTS